MRPTPKSLRRILLFLLLTLPCLAQAPFDATNLGNGTRDLSGLWQFHTGDDPAWAQPTFDDSTWDRIPANRPWGREGHPGYVGYAWYRLHLKLDPSTNLALYLPPLRDVAQVYWNGQPLGGIGTPPPHPVWFWVHQPAAVLLPPTTTTGTLAIRLWQHPLESSDAPDAGGFLGMPVLGTAPVIQQKVNSFWEHRFHFLAVEAASELIYFLFGLATFLYWLRDRTQWVVLCVAVYIAGGLTLVVPTLLPNTTGVWGELLLTIGGSVAGLAVWLLLTLLFELPLTRLWVRLTLAAGLVVFVCCMASAPELALALNHPTLFHFLDMESGYLSPGFPIITLILLVGGLATRRLVRSARIFAIVLVSYDLFLNFLSIIQQTVTRADSIFLKLQHPLFYIYGSPVDLPTLFGLLVLASMLYAVWDQTNQQRVQQRLQNAEFHSAREIQQILVPEARSEDTPGYTIHSVYRPASEVGGDFFQVIPLADRSTLIVTGDVSGKGLRAAMTVSLIVGTLRTLAEQDPTPANVLAGLNRRLQGRVQGGFATCCAVLVHPDGQAVFANAGHCQPYIDGRELDLPTGLPLGIVDGLTFDELTLTLPAAAHLVLLSDGIPEARNPSGELFGFDRTTALSTQSAEAIAQAAVAFGQDDDITVLTLTRIAVLTANS